MKMRLDAKKIYLAMAEKGLTVTEIARQGGVSQQAVSNALNGSRVGKVKVVPAGSSCAYDKDIIIFVAILLQIHYKNTKKDKQRQHKHNAEIFDFTKR